MRSAACSTTSETVAPEKHDELPVRIMRLEALVQAITVGLLAGLVVFVATNWLVLRGGPVVGPHLVLLAQFVPGYEVTFVGSLIGFTVAFAYGSAAGALLGAVYNGVLARRARRGRSRVHDGPEGRREGR